jgi:hypothetical protein
MTAKSMPLVGQDLPADIEKDETTQHNLINEFKDSILTQIRERYISLLEEHLSRI